MQAATYSLDPAFLRQQTMGESRGFVRGSEGDVTESIVGRRES